MTYIMTSDQLATLSHALEVDLCVREGGPYPSEIGTDAPTAEVSKFQAMDVSNSYVHEGDVTVGVNLTPHDIKLNDGRIYRPSGEIARVGVSYSDIIDDVTAQVFGEVEGLPPQAKGVLYIVSGLVLAANKERQDLVAPATGHPEVVRDDKGRIVSVPCFTK